MCGENEDKISIFSCYYIICRVCWQANFSAKRKVKFTLS
ncbi:hypothetical protein [uncultured Campylobacter sp.]